MQALFIKLLNMSIAAGFVIAAVIIIRLVFRKAPKNFRCFLWAMAAFRLVCPYSPQSSASLLPDTEPVTTAVVYEKKSEPSSLPEEISEHNNKSETKSTSGTSTLPENKPEPLQDNPPVVHDEENSPPQKNDNTLPTPSTTSAETETTQTNNNFLSVIPFIWIAGTSAMMIYAVIGFISIKRKTREAVPLKDNIFICDVIDTPFIAGIVRPKIYLPTTLDNNDRNHVIAHENAHLRHFDHIWKPFGFLLLSIYWFNPMVWAAYILFCKDIELACDERVVRDYSLEGKKSYSNALINCSAPRSIMNTAPLAFGEPNVKERVVNVLSYKKPALWVILGCVIAAAGITLCLLTNPVSVENRISEDSDKTSSNVSTDTSKPVSSEPTFADDPNFDIILDEMTWSPPADEDDEESLALAKEQTKEIEQLVYDIINDESLSDKDIEQKQKEMENIINCHLYQSESSKKDNQVLIKKALDYRNERKEKIEKIHTEYGSLTDEQVCRLLTVWAIEGESGDQIGSSAPYRELCITEEIDPDAPKLTYEDVKIILKKCRDTQGGYSYFMEEIEKIQKAPDYLFIGSGVYGYKGYDLNSENESLWFVLAYMPEDITVTYSKVDKEGNKIYTECLLGPWNGKDISVLDRAVEEKDMADREEHDRLSEEQINEQDPDTVIDLSDLPEESDKSTEPEVVHTLSEKAAENLMYNRSSNYLSYLGWCIDHSYQDLTQEQYDKIFLLRDRGYPDNATYFYQEGIISGDVDPTAPKLTLNDVNRIISDIRNGKTFNFDGKSYSLEQKNERYIEIYIFSELSKIQKFPDAVAGFSEFRYWLDGNSLSSRRQEITIEEYTPTIRYNQYDDRGKLISSEILYDLKEQ